MVPEPDKPAGRLLSVDAYRGFVMLAMASGGAAILGDMPRAPDSPLGTIIHTIGQQLEHVEWRGCAFWDMIQPSFMFLVGVAMPFSYASRRARGDSRSKLLIHALARSLILIALAVFLSSNGAKHTNWVFVNVLAQIGLGYTFVFLVLDRRAGVQGSVAAAILAGYWLLFALYPVNQVLTEEIELGKGVNTLAMPGFLAHWNKNTNVAAAFDRWLLNLFPQANGRPFQFNEGGYATLNFVPSMATMIFGVMAGELLRSGLGGSRKFQILLVAGALGWAAGSWMDSAICPIVKRIWTPSWVLFSTGWSCWMLAGFFGVTELLRFRKWAFPLVLVGMNSIAIYVMAQLMKPFLAASLRTHLGSEIFSGPQGRLAQSLAVLSTLWLICYWLYRQKIFIKV